MESSSKLMEEWDQYTEFAQPVQRNLHIQIIHIRIYGRFFTETEKVISISIEN